MDEGQFIGQARIPGVNQLREHFLRIILGTLDDFPDVFDRLGEIIKIALVIADGLFPVPLINVCTVIMIEKIVFTNRSHIGVNAFTNITAEGLESHTFPLRSRLYYLCIETLFQSQSTRKLNGCA